MPGGPKPQPTTASELPECPKWLTARQRELWRSIVPELACSVALKRCDSIGLADMVLCLDRLQQAEADIDARGMLVQGHRGVMTKNPSVMVSRSYRESFTVWAKAFGLDLKSRMRLPKVSVQSPIDAARARLRESVQ
jgi:P27 family predicted phage terminase small subunit